MIIFEKLILDEISDCTQGQTRSYFVLVCNVNAPWLTLLRASSSNSSSLRQT